MFPSINQREINFQAGKLAAATAAAKIHEQQKLVAETEIVEERRQTMQCHPLTDKLP